MSKISRAVFFLLSLSLSGIVLSVNAQSIEEKIININQEIDNAVVKKDILTLNRLYGDDFVFTHGTGTVDSKESWIGAVKKADMKFISREHDSTQVELHDEVAILTGKLSVVRQDKGEEVKYSLRYIRVFTLRKKMWQLISHRTVEEWHH